jgi:glycosyltransferase involved in cell wall biosynthesis
LEIDRRYGEWLASELSTQPFQHGYFFSQIARESLLAARERDTATVLDNPNGHIRDFAAQLCAESVKWTGMPYLGHPSEAMVQRVEDEYRLADCIRVSSAWARRSLVDGGVDDHKIVVVPQGIDITRFQPAQRQARTGPLKIVFVGSVSVGKGFQYLLQAMKRLGPRHSSLEIVGASGDPWSNRLLRRMSAGLNVTLAAGDPLPAYQRGELFVLPTLHDGFGLVVAEAMACGLPVITTAGCGASEWIAGDCGWVIPRGDAEVLTSAVDRALSQRQRLSEMGRARDTTSRWSGARRYRPGMAG